MGRKETKIGRLPSQISSVWQGLKTKKVAIIGVGHSRFGDRSDVNLSELSFEAIKPALESSGLTAKDIPYMALGSMGVWSEEVFHCNDLRVFNERRPMEIEESLIESEKKFRNIFNL